MQLNLLKINIANEMDVVLAYKRAMQLSERLCVSMVNQTKFSTAVSEICRNVVEYVGSGQIEFNITEAAGKKYLEAVVADRGRGIADTDQYLQPATNNSTLRGSGISNSRKLVDYFHIVSEHEKGTRVTIRQRLPHNAPTVSKAIAEDWIDDLNQETVSPYAEIKHQNMQLLEVLDSLREKNEIAQQQLEVIGHLNQQLQLSNSNIQELLEEREKQNIMLQRINNDLDAFAHTVSHDLRAPLQNIAGLTSALEDCVASNKIAETTVLFPMLHEQTQRMDSFITSVLSYSRAGQNNLPKTETDVKELIKEVISLHGISQAVTMKYPAFLPVLETEKIFLHQVFSNIISNALKYHDLDEQPVIEILYRNLGEWLQFSVKDNGPGIPPENSRKIFEMYENLGNVNLRKDSLGLGLSIVQKIIFEKGGRVWVESDGRGAEFIFTWPAKELVKS